MTNSYFLLCRFFIVTGCWSESNSAGAKIATNATKGSLCYYSPWADVVLFYAHHGRGNQLYDIGKCIFGIENIEKLNGNITVSRVELNS